MGKPLLIFFLFVTATCFSQEVPNHTWKIVVKDSLTVDQNFALVVQKLLENDFSIQNKDPKSFTIQSTIKQIDKSRITYFLKFLIKPGVIEVTGEWNTNTPIYLNGIRSESTFGQIENRGGRIGEVFEMMKSFAAKLGGIQSYVFD